MFFSISSLLFAKILYHIFLKNNFLFCFFRYDADESFFLSPFLAKLQREKRCVTFRVFFYFENTINYSCNLNQSEFTGDGDQSTPGQVDHAGRKNSAKSGEIFSPVMAVELRPARWVTTGVKVRPRPVKN